jgi:hypothetical protein
LLCVSGFYGLIGALLIVGLVAVVRAGGVRLALAAALRWLGVRLYRWLNQGGRDDC